MVTTSRRKALIPAPRLAAVVPLTAGEGDLQALYDRYRAISSKLAPDLVSTPEMAQVRSALIRALLEDGWKAPEVVLERLQADEAILRPALVVA
ncbi:MAG: hypothetical protein QOE05_1322 [Actinomycetota bacterium]|jgi:hypothetical protein|nr:hypothetical protein [Actinomycetota bacterium]